MVKSMFNWYIRERIPSRWECVDSQTFWKSDHLCIVLHCAYQNSISGRLKSDDQIEDPNVWPKIVEPARNAEPTLPVPKIKQDNKGRGQHKEDITNNINSKAYIISCIQLISLGSQSNFVHL